MKKNKLLYIRGLMGVSLLLLCVLIGSWLNAQYKEQKQQLQEDLQDDLAVAQKDVSDSMLYFNVLKPILNVSKVSGGYRQINLDKHGGNAMFKLVITDHGDSSSPIEIKKKLRVNHDIDINNKAIKTINEKIATTYTINDPKEEILKQSLSLVMEELFQQVGVKDDSVFGLDTAHLRKSFTKKLEGKNWHFTTIWNNDIAGTPAKHKAIFISTNYLSKYYTVAVNNYSGYLLKKMLPQALFSLTLLLFVAAAFYISLRSLKEQMRLSIMKNDLISNMSHELKTPISTVKVALEALTTFNVAQNPQTMKEYLGMASLEMNRLDMLVNQALNTSLLEEGKIVIQKECIDLKKIAEDVSQMLQLRIRQTDARLNIHTAGIDFTTQADPLHIQGVIINMIDNSIKYADKEPVINLTIESSNNTLNVSVADNGPGIPAEHISHVFDKFYRVPHGNQHNVKGYGLGLSYSKQVALQHNGDITARNQQPEGCIFTLTLPKVPC